MAKLEKVYKNFTIFRNFEQNLVKINLNLEKIDQNLGKTDQGKEKVLLRVPKISKF